MRRIDLARALGISLQMLARLKARGMPVDDLQAAVAWRLRNMVASRLKGTKAGTKVDKPAKVDVPAVPQALAEPPDELPAMLAADPVQPASPQPQPAPVSDAVAFEDLPWREQQRRLWGAGDPRAYRQWQARTGWWRW